jgi:SOS response regulatory protein OraA/RecX
MEKEKEPGQKDKKIIRKELETKAIPSAIIEAIVEEEEEVEVEPVALVSDEEEIIAGDIEEGPDEVEDEE